MEGILDELLRLEDAKHKALIGFDSASYERWVNEQTLLLDDGRLPVEAGERPEKLLAFSKLARLNTALYENILLTSPWIAKPSRSYDESGHLASSAMSRTFSAEA